mgnify:CR=1 FL=1
MLERLRDRLLRLPGEFLEPLVDLRLRVMGPGRYGEMLARAGFGDLVDEARSGTPVPELARRMPIELPMSVGAIGSAGDVRTALERYEAAGAETVALVPMTWDDPALRGIPARASSRPSSIAAGTRAWLHVSDASRLTTGM